MAGLLFLFRLFPALGLFFLAASTLWFPTIDTVKAMLGNVKQEKETAKAIETYLMTTAMWLAKYIRMDEYKRNWMHNVLKTSGMNLIPGVCQAYTSAEAGAILLDVIPRVSLLPLLSSIVIILSLLTYFRESQKADERLKAK